MNSEKSNFALYLNGMAVTNDEVIQLDKTRDLLLRVQNTSGIAVENVTLNFIAPLATTNLSTYGLWSSFDHTTIPINGKFVENLVGVWSTTLHLTMPSDWYSDAPPLNISTNFQGTKLITRIDVFSDKVKKQKFIFYLTFEP